MIQMLINLGKWLEQRFPKQVVLVEQDYQQLKKRIQDLEDRYIAVEELTLKIRMIETTAVHKEPVQELIKAMAQMKAEIVSLRAGLGITASATSPEAMETMLNGAFISQGDTNNG